MFLIFLSAGASLRERRPTALATCASGPLWDSGLLYSSTSILTVFKPQVQFDWRQEKSSSRRGSNPGPKNTPHSQSASITTELNHQTWILCAYFSRDHAGVWTHRCREQERHSWTCEISPSSNPSARNESGILHALEDCENRLSLKLNLLKQPRRVYTVVCVWNRRRVLLNV